MVSHRVWHACDMDVGGAKLKGSVSEQGCAQCLNSPGFVDVGVVVMHLTVGLEIYCSHICGGRQIDCAVMC